MEKKVNVSVSVELYPGCIFRWWPQRGWAELTQGGVLSAGNHPLALLTEAAQGLSQAEVRIRSMRRAVELLSPDGDGALYQVDWEDGDRADRD